MFKKELSRWLELEVKKLLNGCKVKSFNGINLYTPDGKHNYNALWTRDFSYMVENAYSFIPKQDIKKCIQYILKGIRKDGAVPDRIKIDGKPLYVAGPEDKPIGEPNIDNVQFLVNLLYTYSIKSGDGKFFQNNLKQLDLAMDYIPLSPYGLVYNSKNKPHSTYGFIDCVLITGELLFCTLLYWLSCVQIIELVDKINNIQIVSKYKAKKKLIEQNIYRLYDKEKGMFYSSNGINKKIDIWGNLFIIYINFPLKKGIKDKIIKFLIDNYDNFVYCGQVRHLLKDEYWDKFLIDISKEEYQNGAYWGTATGWLIYAIYQKNRNLAIRTFKDFILYSQKEGLCECVNADYKKLPAYVATGANVYGAIKRTILEEVK